MMFGVIKIGLEKLIKKHKKSMYAVAKDNDISYATVHKLCRSEKPIESIDLKILEKLCKYFDCSPNDILIFEK